uniref:Uncharacterized protein n=1 Tax=Anopheles farauti TaxID=69004 RepID=A0A182QDZ9_9DIPT
MPYLQQSRLDLAVITVQAVDQCLHRRFLQMAQIGCRLSRFLAQHECVVIDQSERVNHNLSLHGLNRIDYDGHCTFGQCFERLLRVDIDTGQPASETGMGMVPSNHHLRATGLLQHVQHFRLKHGINGFDGHTGTSLWHSEHINHLHSVVIDKLACNHKEKDMFKWLLA